ncbi:MAG: sensor histidine kinase [Halioglobus sp.]
MEKPGDIVLRESLRARATVASVSIVATFSAIAMFIPFMRSQGVLYSSIATWAMPIVALMFMRGFYSAYIRREVDSFSYDGLLKADWVLRISSIINQTAVGAGIWIIQSPTVDSYVLPLFMTLVTVIWSIGVLANLFSDFPSFVLSMPLLIFQPAAYWLLRADIGISISIGMVLAMLLMVLLVRRGTEVFRESVLMRFEKDKLLEEVERQRLKTEQALAEAQAANESKAYFMAAAGHDIKQPLYALGMLTDTLLMSNPSDSAGPILQRQKESIAQMQEHFDSLMDLGRLERSGFKPTLATVALAQFSKRIDYEMAPLCAEKGLRWHIDLGSAYVQADEELLLRLFRNLVSNAVRYTLKGEIRCIACVDQGQVRFEISDTGVGISEEDQSLVFGEFVRLEQAGSDATGAGLGLSIVAKIDEALGLNLSMSSEVGVGTRYQFSLAQSPP